MSTPNAVHCRKCHTRIESRHRHDFQRCACPDDDTAVWVDGGNDYRRRLWGPHSDFVEVTE